MIRYGTADGNLEGLLLGVLLGSVYEIKLGANEWTELGFWYGRMFGTTLGSLEGLLPGKSERIELGFSGIWKPDLYLSPTWKQLSSQ